MAYHIAARRWFSPTRGATYNAVTIYKDGEVVAQLAPEYGYGTYCLQRAHEWLAQNGHPELAKRHENGSPVVCTTIWLRENGHSYDIADVMRMRDL